MYCFLPTAWEEVISHRAGVCVINEYSVSAVREALTKGENLFLIGAEAIAKHDQWLVVKDHLSLFDSGTLVGRNNPIGPRFPNLRGMYIVPQTKNLSVQSGIVLRVPDIRLSTGAELNAFSCDALVSSGLDLAIAAAHGGAKVIFVLKCRSIYLKTESKIDFSFLNELVQEVRGGEK